MPARSAAGLGGRGAGDEQATVERGSPMTLSGAQIREARELLGWQPSRLASKVGSSVRVHSIKRAEGGLLTLIDMNKVQRCLEVAGVDFTDDGRVVLRNAMHREGDA